MHLRNYERSVQMDPTKIVILTKSSIKLNDRMQELAEIQKKPLKQVAVMNYINN